VKVGVNQSNNQSIAQVDITGQQVTVSAAHVDQDASHGTFASRSFQRSYTVRLIDFD